MHNYHDVDSAFPPARLGIPESSWRIAMLPYIERGETARLYDRSQPWDSYANEPLQKQQINVYACPGRPSPYDSQGRFLTSYVVPTDNGAIFGSKTGTSFKDITDGTTNTLLILEACGSEIIWTEPRDEVTAAPSISVNGPGSAIGLSDSMLSSWHTGGAQVLLADGSVRFVSESIEPDILRGLLTKNGGEPTGEF